jgi:ABC-type transport system substrate-binding protein
VVRVRGRFAVFLLTVLLLPLVSGCGSAADAHPQTILRLPLYGYSGRLDPGLLDPARATSETPLYAASLLDAGLVKLGPDLHVIPDLAVSIPTISSDGTTYTFTIRQDARFADGRACTSRDVVYSLTRALRPGTGSTLAQRYLGGIAGAEAVESGAAARLAGVAAVDRLTVRITLSRPDATFLDRLAFPVAAIVEHGSGLDPAGLGPWLIEGHLADGTVILRPRPHYYGGSLAFRQARLVPVSSESQALELYRKDALDAAQVPFSALPSLQSRPELHESESVDGYYALAPPVLGRLLSTRLDRDQLAQDASPSLSALDTLVPPAVPDYVATAPSTSAPGAAHPLPAIELSYDSRDPALAALAQALRAQWPVSARARDHVRLIHQVFDLPDPGRWLLTVLPETGSRWLRSVLGQANTLTNDPVSRMNLYGEAEQWALSQGFVVPLASGSIGYLVRPTVQNLLVTPVGIMPQNNNWTLVTLQ